MNMTTFELFNKRFDEITTEHTFDTEWKNNTGYLDNVNLGAVPVGYIARGVDDANRRFIAFRSPGGDGVVFTRYTPNPDDTDTRNPIVSNLPRDVRVILHVDTYISCPVSLDLILGMGYPKNNIGDRLRRFCGKRQVRN